MKFFKDFPASIAFYNRISQVIQHGDNAASYVYTLMGEPHLRYFPVQFQKHFTVGSIPRPVCARCPLDLIMISWSSPSETLRGSSTEKSIQTEGTLFAYETPLWY